MCGTDEELEEISKFRYAHDYEEVQAISEKDQDAGAFHAYPEELKIKK